MLNQVHFENIKSLVRVNIKLERLTVLVGPNGCGKSTVLDQVDRLCLMSRPMAVRSITIGNLHPAMEFADEERSSFAKKDMMWRGLSDQFMLTGVLPPGIDPFYMRARLLLHGSQLLPDAFSHTAPDENFWQLMRALGANFNWRCMRLRLHRELIQAPAPVTEVVSMEPTGYGIAPLLVDMRLNDSERFERIEQDLRAVVPQFERFNFRREALAPLAGRPLSEGGAKVGYSLDLVFRGAGKVPAKHASEGTLLALALLTAVHAHELPNLVLIDDIDHGLHLSAQYTLIKAIRGVMEARPELQILCTSHAPVLLDSFDVKEVRVMALDKDGATRVRPLVDAPGFERLSRGMGTGEIWASLGEDWVLNDA